MIQRRSGRPSSDTRRQKFAAFRRRPRKKWVVFPAFQFRSQICPRLNSLLRPERRGTFGYLNWGLVMGPAYPPDSKQEFLEQQGCLDETLLADEEFTDDEHSDDNVSLLEENARLRGIVVRLTGIILRSIADRG